MTKIQIENSNRKIDTAISILKEHERGLKVLSCFKKLMDPASGLDSIGWMALVDLVNESSKGRRFGEKL